VHRNRSSSSSPDPAAPINKDQRSSLAITLGLLPCVETVRYDAVNAMLLNEFLKEHRTEQKQQKELDALKAQLKEQAEIIQKVRDQLELSKPAPRVTENDQ
jgi:hypothetical protein